MGSQPIGISASRGAAILGLSKYKTQVEAWLEIMEEREPGFCAKHNYKMPEPVDNASIRWGRAFESAVIELAECEQNSRIYYREQFYQKDYITCHIDGLYNSELAKKQEYNPHSYTHLMPHTLHEGKTTNEWTFRESFGEPGTDAIPIEYQIQVQHQMICTGAEKVILSVLCFPKRVEEWEEMGFHPEKTGNYSPDDYRIKFWGKPEKTDILDGCFISPKSWAITLRDMGYFHQYHIPANPELQKKLIDHYTDFWQNNVLKQIPPEPRDISDIKLLYRDPVGTVIATPHVSRMVNELRDIQSELGDGGSLKKRVDQLKTEIMKFIVDSEKITDDDSLDKYILRDDTGKKLASYYRNKNGTYIFK